MPDAPTLAQLCEKIASDINAFLRKRDIKPAITANLIRLNVEGTAGTQYEMYTKSSHIKAGANSADMDAVFAKYKEGK